MVLGFVIFPFDINADRPNDGDKDSDPDKKYKKITHAVSPSLSRCLINLKYHGSHFGCHGSHFRCHR